MAFSDQYLFSASYQKNNCVSVAIGHFIIGEVFLSHGAYEYSPKSFELHVSQLYEFILLLKKLGSALSQHSHITVGDKFSVKTTLLMYGLLSQEDSQSQSISSASSAPCKAPENSNSAESAEKRIGLRTHMGAAQI